MDSMSEQPANMPAQPPTLITNVIVTNQPTKSNDLMVTGPIGERPWSTGLFDCCDDVVGTILTFLFMPCMECKLANRMGEFCLMPYCVCGGTLALRTKLRIMGSIRGSILKDAGILSYCGPCAVCQMSRELELMGIP